MSKTNWKKYKELKSKIKNEISRKESSWENINENLIKIAIEAWKIDKRMKKNWEQLSEHFLKWIDFSLEKIFSICKNWNIHLMDNSWEDYHEEMNWIEIVSTEGMSSLDWRSYIKDMIEPTVLLNWKLHTKWKAILSTRNS